MRNLIASREKNRVSVWAAALVLLALSLVIPQIALADGRGDYPRWQVWNGGSTATAAESRVEYPRWQVWNGASANDSSSSASAGEIAGVYARSFAGMLAREADEAAAAGADPAIAKVIASSFAGLQAREADEDRSAVRSVGLIARSSSISANAEAASVARWVAMGDFWSGDAAFAAANPEVRAFLRSAAAQRQAAAAEASSARWVALGTFYAGSNGTFLAANPEAGAFERFIGREDCVVIGIAC